MFSLRIVVSLAIRGCLVNVGNLVTECVVAARHRMLLFKVATMGDTS